MTDVAITLEATEANPVVGDLWLTSGHEVVLSDKTSLVLQKVFVVLNFFRGEYPLDLERGVPYYEEILFLPPRRNVIQAVFTRALLAIPDVEAVEELTYRFDKSTRELFVSFRLRVASDEPIDVHDFMLTPADWVGDILALEDEGGCIIYEG